MVTSTLVAALIGARTSEARQVRFGLHVDFESLRGAMLRTLAAGPEGSRMLWQDGGGCRAVVLRDVRLQPTGERLSIVAESNTRVGIQFLGFCLFPLSWRGRLEMETSPEVGPDWILRLRDPISTLYDEHGKTTSFGSRIWERVRGRVEHEVERVSVDLSPPIEGARQLVRDCAPAGRARAVEVALASLRPAAAVVEENGVRIDVVLDVPDEPSGETGRERPLERVEIQKWRSALESWDGFLAFVIKDLGLGDRDPTVLDELLELLLSSRYRLLTALGEEPSGGVDPVRQLFLEAWEVLRGIVRREATRASGDERALRYLRFLTAGDALAALDTVGPSLGLEISADGLRRLARALEPTFMGDPLAYTDSADPELRDLFHFHDPEEPARPSDDSPPSSWEWLIPDPAYADSGREDVAQLARRLDRWVPARDDLDPYRDAVGRLLQAITSRAAVQNAVEGRFTDLFGLLVHTVAWQESCWRHFVRRDGVVTFLLSNTDDVGIMQVNRRVWRGFFDLRKLEWDIAYNARAGAEILAQLLTRYGAREAGGRVENAARATYCAYNGGPRAYRRYRQAHVPRRERAIDRGFWEKYLAMAAGRALDFVLCVQDWGTHSRDQLSVAPPASRVKRCCSPRRSAATRTRASRQPPMASRPRASLV